MKSLTLLAFISFFYRSVAFASIPVAVTIDDLPIHGALPMNTSRIQIAKKMLSVLKNNNIPEVYGFINGKKVDDSKDLLEILKLWRASGYPLGNHTFSHPDLTQVSAQNFKQEIDQNESLLKSLSEETDWHYFRYPFLREGETLEKRDAVRSYLKSKGYKIAQVTIDFEDWAWNNPYARCTQKNDQQSIEWIKSTYLNNALEKLHRSELLSQHLFKRPVKQILLLHIGGLDAEMLDTLLKAYKKVGVEFIPLSEAVKDEIYSINPNVPATSGEHFFSQIMEARKLKLSDVGLKRFTDFPEEKLNNICK